MTEETDKETALTDAELRKYLLRKARLLIYRRPDIPSDAADDLTQRALLKYYDLPEERRDRIVDSRAYLYTVIRNELSDYVREQRPGSVLPLETAENPLAETPAPGGRERLESDILFHEIWTQLEGDERLLLEFLLLGYSGKELAIRLGISPAAATKRVERLRRLLKELLTEGAWR